jgi:predicted membrane-bound spermidine synthase
MVSFYGLGCFRKKGETDMTASWLLAVAAAIEAATGIALIIYPQAVARLLLGADLAGAGIAVGRVAGVALLSLGLVCWRSRQRLDKTVALAALPLWPAIAIHAVLTLLFVYVWLNDQAPE